MRGPKRPGDIDDPVARSIRNEQMADAAPSHEEVEAERRQYLHNKGCKVCGEDDPDKLSESRPYVPSCSAVPLHYPDPEVFCDKHKWDAKERELGRKLKSYDYVVEYECGVMLGYMANDDHPHEPAPEVPVAHRCGKTIEEVHDGRDEE